MFTGARVPDCDFVGAVGVIKSDLADRDSDEAVTGTDKS